MKIYLIRHAEANSKIEGAPLTKRGIKEAKIVAKELLNCKIERVYFSNLLRAKQTAQEYLKLNPSVKSTCEEKLSEIYRVLIGGPEKIVTSKDRKINDKKRADEIFEEILKKEEDVAIFCHGNIIRYYLNKVLKSKENLWEHLTIDNCSISIISLENSILKIEGINLNKNLKKEEKKEVYLE